MIPKRKTRLPTANPNWVANRDTCDSSNVIPKNYIAPKIISEDTDRIRPETVAAILLGSADELRSIAPNSRLFCIFVIS